MLRPCAAASAAKRSRAARPTRIVVIELGTQQQVYVNNVYAPPNGSWSLLSGQFDALREHAAQEWKDASILLAARGVLGPDHVLQRRDRKVRPVNLDDDGVAAQVLISRRSCRLERYIEQTVFRLKVPHACSGRRAAVVLEAQRDPIARNNTGVQLAQCR